MSSATVIDCFPVSGGGLLPASRAVIWRMRRPTGARQEGRPGHCLVPAASGGAGGLSCDSVGRRHERSAPSCRAQYVVGEAVQPGLQGSGSFEDHLVGVTSPQPRGMSVLTRWEQSRSAQMYWPTVLPLRPASPARRAVNSETSAPDCVL